MVVLVSAMRNEGPFVLEWVAYHQLIGIDRIVIISNGSTDGSEKLLLALAEAGEITYLRTAPGRGVRPQQAAREAFEAQVGYQSGAWHLWLDADEFLNVHVGDRTVQALIDQLNGASAIMLNWRLFGSGGNGSFSGRHISAEFTGASKLGFVANLETKPLFLVGEKFHGFAINCVGLPRLMQGAQVSVDDCRVGNGMSLDTKSPRTTPWLESKPYKGRNNLATRREFGWDLAQINHYSVRTPDHFRLKAARGNGMTPTGSNRPRLRHTPSYFSRFDRNEAEDCSILVWERAVTKEIDRLLSFPDVAAAKAEVDTRVARALTEIDTAPLVEENYHIQKMMPDMNAKLEPESDARPAFELTFPEAEAAFLRQQYTAGRTILEYGSGGSTVLAAKAGCHVISVESDQAWAGRLAEHLATISDTARVHHADIGPTGDWGVPRRVNEFGKFHSYALSVWDRPDFEEPDLVLIDGRFRASCLVAVLLRARRPTTVLFDDYLRRRYYHGVEALAQKEEMIGRMARFTVTPGPIPPAMMTRAIGWFTDQR